MRRASSPSLSPTRPSTSIFDAIDAAAAAAAGDAAADMMGRSMKAAVGGLAGVKDSPNM